MMFFKIKMKRKFSLIYCTIQIQLTNMPVYEILRRLLDIFGFVNKTVIASPKQKIFTKLSRKNWRAAHWEIFGFCRDKNL